VLVTGEYRFQRRLMRYSPSPDYIDTFYLGEMTRGDALSLYRYFRGEEPREEEKVVVEQGVGGHPGLLKEIASKWGLSYVCRYVRRVQQIVVEHRLSLAEDGEALAEELEEMLEKLAEKPLARTARRVEVLDELVERGVLQYGCSVYLGIYEWNRDCGGDAGGVEGLECGGGGWCGGLDVVAPANRLMRIGLLLAVDRRPEIPEPVRRLCRV